MDSIQLDDYQILRYRDDYRIFVNNPTHAVEILKIISEIMYGLGMKLNPYKTEVTPDVVKNSMRADKIEWITQKQSNENFQKHLFLIHDFTRRQPNSASLLHALYMFYSQLLAV